MVTLMKVLTVLSLTSLFAVSGLRLEKRDNDNDQDSASLSSDANHDRAVWNIEVMGSGKTNKYWKMTSYCGRKSDEFEIQTVPETTRSCKDKSGKQHVLVRKKTEFDADHVFIRNLGCADQDIRIVFTEIDKKGRAYSKDECDFPTLNKFAFDYDCNWDSDVQPVNSQVLVKNFNNDYSMEEECAEMCTNRAHRSRTKADVTTCNSWVVEQGADASTGTCKLSDSDVLRPLRSGDRQKFRCGNTKKGPAGQAWTDPTPNPTPYLPCDQYTTYQECPDEKCEWSEPDGNGGWTRPMSSSVNPVCHDPKPWGGWN